MSALTQTMMFGLAEVEVTPSDRKRKRAYTKDERSEFFKLMWEQEGLLLVSMAAAFLGISRQRVYVLIEQGKLSSWEYCGTLYVSGKEVSARIMGVDKRTTAG